MTGNIDPHFHEFDHASPKPANTSEFPPLMLVEDSFPVQANLSRANEVNQVGVICVKNFLFEGERDGKIERLTLPKSGNTLTTVVIEADKKLVEESGSADTLFIVRGFGEIPSAGKKSSAHNLLEGCAQRNPHKRIVAVDRHGYSKYGPALTPWKALSIGFEKDEDAVADLLDTAAHYSKAKVKLLGSSAGAGKVIEMAYQNIKADEVDRLDIENELLLVVPCVVAKKVPEDSKFRTHDESEMVTRLKTTGKFVAHVPVNLVESSLRNPRDTIGCAGILGTLAVRPWLLPILPAQFLRHMSGTDFSVLREVTQNHSLRIIEADKDPLKAEEQYGALEKINPGSITHFVVAGEGHISLPIAVNKTLDALGMEGDSPRQDPGLVESGANLVASSVRSLRKIATRSLPAIGSALPKNLRRIAL